MARTIGAAALALVGLALIGLGFTMGGPATAMPAREPSIGWLAGRAAKPAAAEPTPAAQVPAKVEEQKAEPAAEVKAEPAAEVKAEPASAPAPEKPAEPAPLAAKPEQQAAPVAKAEPVKAEPAKAEPAKPEPAKAEPAKLVAEPEAKKPEVKKPEVKPEPLVAEEAPEPKPVAAAKPAKPARPAAPVEEEGTGTLTINSMPPDAEVYLDGANVGMTPVDIDVSAGSHRIKVVNPESGEEKKQSVRVKAGKTTEVTISF